ncbi:MAG TPA: membrane protein insertase YidC [Clostridia bacterium]|nr:membrane protein insertase YidC [Clostridia bacterium]
MEFINSFFGAFAFVDASALPDLNAIGKLVQLLYNWIGNYGWTVVVFTVFLKLLTLPLDFWQRYSTKKNADKMEDMKPLLANIDKQYGHDQNKANEEKRKLYKKQGYSMGAQCLPLIITMAVFIFMFSGLQSYTNYISKYNYALLTETYITAFNENLAESGDQSEALEAGQEAVKVIYTNEIEEKFLWINNIWRPDTWSATMADADTYVKGGMGSVALTAVEKAEFSKEQYNVIREAVIEVSPGYFSKINTDGSIKAGWNGLIILPILAVALTFLSTWITQKQTAAAKKSNDEAPDPTQQSSKMMMFMMPIMMGAFAIFYTAAFAVYMVSNSMLTILTTFIIQPIVNSMVEKKKNQNKETKASYKR